MGNEELNVKRLNSGAEFCFLLSEEDCLGRVKRDSVDDLIWRILTFGHRSWNVGFFKKCMEIRCEIRIFEECGICCTI